MVGFHRGFSITTAGRGERSLPALRCGRWRTPNSGRSVGTSNRDRVRSTTVSKTRSITAPEAKSRLRLYSTW